jgi:hypothetical protein
MLSLFKKGFVTVLVFTAGLIVSGLAYDQAGRYTDQDPLLPRSANSSKLSSNSDYLKGLTTESEPSREYLNHIDELAKAFENFESLSLTDQDLLLNEWKDKVTSYGLTADLNRHGFAWSFDISPETIQKLKRIESLYSRSKKQPWAVL